MKSQDQITDRYPLSSVQQGMLFHHLEAPNSGAYIQQLTVTLRESADAFLLREAWELLLDRHSALRTTFHCPTHGAPVQQVHASAPLQWQDFDWSSLESNRQETLFADLLAAEQCEFDLSHAPLMRLACCQFGPTESRLVWTFHHIIADGRSRFLLVKEVVAHYEALKHGLQLSWPDPVPYSHYIRWLEQQDFSRSEAFWRYQLHGYTARAQLSVRGTNGKSSGRNTQEDRLTPEATALLKDFAARNELTLNTLVQAVWAFLLSRYTGESDVVFGATRACRKSTVAGSESMIGMLINTVPVRVSIRPEDSVLDCLKALRAQWLAVREHEHTPLRLIQAWSNMPPGEPLFETIVVLEHSSLETQLQALDDRWRRRSVCVYQQTHYPLTLEVYGDASLLLRLDYSLARLDDASARRMLGHLKMLFREILEKSAQHPSQLNILTPEERDQLLHPHPHPVPDDSSGRSDGGSTLHTVFEEQSRRTPKAIAVSCEGQSVTYRELNERADELANRLRKIGVGPEVIVGLYLERSIELVVGLLAILKAGGAYLPIDLSYPPERIAFMLDDARAPILVTHSDLLSTLPATECKIVSVDTDEPIAAPTTARDLAQETGSNNLAYVIYTSGSTGNPKGVMVTHGNVLRLFSATAHWFNFSTEDVWTLFHSCAFDFSVWEVWGALLHGGRLVVVPYLTTRSPEQFYHLVADEKVTVLNQTPSAFRQLVAAEGDIGPRQLALRFVIFGGEALEMQTLRPWFDRHSDAVPRLINMYGITETTVHVTYRPVSRDDLTAGSVIGKPIPDLLVYILDEKMRPVPVGVPGEIYVGGAGLARGYLHRPQLSKERFLPNPFSEGRLYKTGDLARFNGDGELEYLGRIDQQVKIRGFRIELGEIETILRAQPGVRDAVVTARDDETTGIKRLIGYVVASDPGPSVTDLRDSLKKQLPDYMVPAAFVVLNALPLTSNGKVDRKALPAPELHREEMGRRYVPPETTLQKQLAMVWAEVLRIDNVGIHDNFFELGGDSILSIQVVAKARQAGLRITPKMLFENLTIASLSTALGTASLPAPEFDDSETGPFPLVPIQHWFFEQSLADANYYNQALLLTLSEPLQELAFRQALEIVKQHHGSLRLGFARQNAVWEQSYGAGDRELCFERIDLSGKPEFEQIAAIEKATHVYQSSLRIDGGPLSRVAYFDLGHSSPSRLLFVVHHLIVDNVSWRILLEDVETAYRQLLKGYSPRLPAKTTSFGRWAQSLGSYANSGVATAERDYWVELSRGEVVRLPTDRSQGDNTEGSTRTVTVALSVEETGRLLQQVPSAFKSQVNEVLVTALAKSLVAWTKADVSFNLEGHGREEIGNEVDVTRTVGWFTSIFPVQIKISRKLVRSIVAESWNPAELLELVKAYLRRIPHRGLSYGMLRYLTNNSILGLNEPEMIFNYLGQVDSIFTNSSLFGFAPESPGPNHSSNQKRRYLLEVNSSVVGGQFKADWTFSINRHHPETIQRLAEEFVNALRRILNCCKSEQDVRHRVASSSFFPDVALSSDEIVDVCPLSPMQSLFFTLASARSEGLVDQWHCILDGELDVNAFQQAWRSAIEQHAVLRTSFDGDTSNQPLQRVHRKVDPTWSIEDWRVASPDEQLAQWKTLLASDARRSFVLSSPPLMRFALRHIDDHRYRFLWSLPPLLVDGWSWPLVFRSVAHAYDRLVKGNSQSSSPQRPFRDYINWLHELDWSQTEAFWRTTLDGFKQPTRLNQSLPGKLPTRDAAKRVSFDFPSSLSKALVSLARSQQTTLSTLIQACWAVILGRRSTSADVVFGVSCSGRPATLPGADSIVGPFVNNLPVRVCLDGQAPLRALIKQLHTRSLDSAPHQFASPFQIQEWSHISASRRLFDSLVVVQNYRLNESVFALGDSVRLTNFVGPIHSNFDLTIVATPREELGIELLFNPGRLDRNTVKAFASDLENLLVHLPVWLDRAVDEIQTGLSTPPLTVNGKVDEPQMVRLPPQTDTERQIVIACEEVLGIKYVGVEDNILESGAHSLTMAKLQQRIQSTLKINLPIVRMFQYPTARSLARYLDGASDDKQELSKISDRALQQRNALSQLRGTREVCR